MHALIIALEVGLLIVLLYYDHYFKKIPNVYLSLLIIFVILVKQFTNKSFEYMDFVPIILLSFFMFALGAIGAGDAKLIMIMSMQFWLVENLCIVIFSTMLGLAIGVIKKYKEKTSFTLTSLFIYRTKFPFLYAYFPVIMFFMFIRGG